MNWTWGIGVLSCACILLIPGSILMIINHDSKDGDVLPATCICTTEPYHWEEIISEPDGNGGTRMRTESRCKAGVLAVTTPLSMVNMTVRTTIYDQCGNCPGPVKCYINSDSREVYYSKWLAENAMESYIAGFIMVGLAGFSCLATGIGFLLPRLHRRYRARAQNRVQALNRDQQANNYGGDYGNYHYSINGYSYDGNGADFGAQGVHATPAGTPIDSPMIDPLPPAGGEELI